jgi:hypothetical protein
MDAERLALWATGEATARASVGRVVDPLEATQPLRGPLQ